MSRSQIKIIFKIKKYFSSFCKLKYSPEFDNIFYPASYTNSISSNFLKEFELNKKSNFFKNFIIILKDIFYSLYFINHTIYSQGEVREYDKIVVTWAFKENFDKNGNLNDRYLNLNSNKDKKVLWFVIYMSDKMPNIIGKNLVLFLRSNKKSLNIFKIIKFILINLKFLPKSLNYFLFSISSFNYFSQILIKKLEPFINYNLKYLIMPYEGQPFQNKIISFLKINNFKTKTIGYIHSPPLALPTNFINKMFSPQKLIVNGKDQYYCFSKILGWKKSQIKILPSFRFLKKNKIKVNSIYLPLTVRDEKFILTSLKYLNDYNYIYIKNLSVKNHPAAKESKKNIKLIKMIESYKKNIKKKHTNKKKNNFLIFIGASGGIIEALERGHKVIQIVETPILDIYSSTIWPNIIKKKLNDKIYMYSIKKRGSLIKFGDKNNSFKSILN